MKNDSGEENGCHLHTHPDPKFTIQYHLAAKLNIQNSISNPQIWDNFHLLPNFFGTTHTWHETLHFLT